MSKPCEDTTKPRVLIGWASAANLQSVADQNRKLANPHWPLNVAPDSTPNFCFPIYVENPPDEM
jgi:hypothetical protein